MDFSDYKDIYVYAEQRDGVIQPVALELIGKARELAQVTNEKVVAILAGCGIAGKANDLVAYGADKVVVIDHELLKDYVTEQYTQAVYQAVVAFKPSIMMFGATTIGRDLAPRIAARLGTGLTADCTKLTINEETHEFEMTRPAFGGNLMATIKCPEHRPQMSTVRPGVMPKAA
ncbi:MAG: electron transfer flavoprotein subunit alpha/FixB family protein, partial [Bacteroidales bacterium]|nr:electron transfer flavoprotein subunit alpha/FixB family protein [Bacteroidales bacterium]